MGFQVMPCIVETVSNEVVTFESLRGYQGRSTRRGES